MTHPSRLKLDLAMIGAAPAEDAAHIAACARCTEQVQAMQSERDVFLAKHPRLRTKPRSRWWAAPAIAAIFALFSVLVLRTGPETTVRTKGGTIAELYVKRGEETFAFDGRPLNEGDTLLFRYTSVRSHLLVIDAEASGKMEVLIDQTIEPGREKLATKGVALDGYLGEERVTALFSDAPLDHQRVLEALKNGEPLPNADEKSWTIEKRPE